MIQRIINSILSRLRLSDEFIVGLANKHSLTVTENQIELIKKEI